jgi:hypothetical protein
MVVRLVGLADRPMSQKIGGLPWPFPSFLSFAQSTFLGVFYDSTDGNSWKNFLSRE